MFIYPSVLTYGKLTSNQSTDHSSVFAMWRQYATYLMHGSLGPRESAFQATSRSVHPTHRRTERLSVMFTV